jgi:hypothetical protein
VHILPTSDAKRAGQQDTVVAYQVDGDPLKTRIVSVPGGNLSEQQLQQAVKADVDKINKLEGLKFNV